MTTSLITMKDLAKIISDAKRNMTNSSLPIKISGSEIEYKHLVGICVVESLLMHLNNRKLLNSEVKLDYTYPLADYEPDNSLEE